MSSYAAFSCTCCRPDSSASGTSDFWLTAVAAHRSYSAFNCLPQQAGLRPQPQPKKKLVHLLGRFGHVRSAAARWS